MLPVSSYFKDYLFFEKGHKYVNITEPKQRYRSSTGVKSEFVNEFREAYWIAWAVLKNMRIGAVNDFGGKCTHDHFRIDGKEYHYTKVWEKKEMECLAIQQKWLDKSDFGKAKGSAVHDFLESLAQRKVKTFDKKYKAWMDNALAYWKQEDTSHVLFTECEIVVGDFDKKISGMIDKLEYISDLEVDIVDLKTDEDLNDTDNYQQLLPPFEHLAQNSINEYSIQVNIYADIVERNTPYSVREIRLVNITDEKWSVHKINRFKVLELL